MIQSFADATTADLWEELNSKAARRVPRDLWRVVHRKLTMLDGVQTMLSEAIPAVQRVKDLTDHTSGENPYYS